MIEGVSREWIENQEYGGRDYLGAGAVIVCRSLNCAAIRTSSAV
jgi:hypothetical protein